MYSVVADNTTAIQQQDFLEETDQADNLFVFGILFKINVL